MQIDISFEIPDLDYQILTDMFDKNTEGVDTVESVTLRKINELIIPQFNQWMKDEIVTVKEDYAITSAQALTAVKTYIETNSIEAKSKIVAIEGEIIK